MGLLVSETPSKETSKGGDVVEVGVFQTTVGRDGMSPHQIPHTEIFESIVIWETGHGALQDTLRGGIWSVAIIPRPVPGAGGSPPDVGIRGRAALGGKKRTIILRNMGVIVDIARRVGRHVVLVISDGR